MKVIIAGSRDVTDMALLKHAIQASGFDITHVVNGGARGVDTLAILFSRKYNLPCTTIHADWKKRGKAAGYKRNTEMAETPGVEALIAIRKNMSRGTTMMIDIAMKRGLKVYVLDI